MKVVYNCDIFPLALVWHENMLCIIYYVFTKMHEELLMFEYDVIWWIVDVWIRCYMMNCWCLNTMLYDELLMFKYDVIWRYLWLMNMKLWCEVDVVVVTTVVVNVFKVVSVVQDDEVIRCCLSCWVHAYSFCWGLNALWAFALYVEGLMPCECIYALMLRVWCPGWYHMQD